MKNLNPKLVFFSIVIIAAVARLVNTPSIPPALSWDEVSLGYNAFSLLQTGRDEHGKFLPVNNFESYGDYKPPLYIYLDVPFVALFGLNELAVRLPSVLFGIVSVVLSYFVVKELFWKSDRKWREMVALCTSFFLAVSPWHLNISRVGYEANVAHTFIIGGVVLLMKAIHGRPVYYYYSVVCFVLSVYAFNSARIFVPVLGAGIGLLYYKKLWEMRRSVFLAFCIGILLLLPLVPHLTSKEGKLRFQEVNIFTDIAPVETANERIEASGNTWWANILHNRRIQFAREMARHYFDNVSMNFLFINGDGNPKFSIRDVGQLYLWDLPFLLFGIYMLIKRKEGDWKIVFVWLLVGILPASIARETPHALRTLNTLPVWQLLVAVGTVEVIRRVSTLKYKYIVYAVLGVSFFLNVLYYLHNYHNSYPKEYASEWQYGYKQAIQKASVIGDQYEKIWITDAIGRPYMYTLFYTQYDPRKFQQEVVRTSDAQGFFTVHSFGKYYFDPIAEPFEERTLYINEPSLVPEGSTVLDTIYLPNGNAVLTLYE